jgi:ubiquinone/menaquinone biosynthesis C-methylase UbiE
MLTPVVSVLMVKVVSSDVDARTAVDFNAYMKRHPGLYEELAACVHDHVTKASPVLLDLGAGTGLLTVELRRRIPTATVLGLDPLRTMLRIAMENSREASQDSLDLLQGISEALPLASSCVDGVVTRFSLPYWKQPKTGFLEIHRVLKPGGIVVLQGLNKEYPRWKQAVLRVLMRMRAAPANVITYHLDAYKLAHPRQWVEDLFTETGFHIIATEGKPRDWQFLVIAQKNTPS